MDSKKTGWITVILLVITVSIIETGLISKKPELNRLSLTDFPYTVGNYKALDLDYPDWLADTLKAEEFIIRKYEDGKGNKIKLYAAYFTSRKGTSTHNPDVCYPAQGWKAEVKGAEVVEIDGIKYILAKRVFKRGHDEQIILFWFQIGDKVYIDKFRHQMAVIKSAVLTNQMRASIVRVSCLNRLDLDEALKIEKDFSKLIIPILKDYLP